MILYEKKGDLFEEKNCYFAHCISSDYALGKGIAVTFEKKYGLKEMLNKNGSNEYPNCILVYNVFNLVTKDKYYNKPTYDTLTEALLHMKKIMLSIDVKKLAMPRIGCGLDRLEWAKVKAILENIFCDMDIEIIVYYL